MDKNLVMRELQKPFKEEEIEWRVGAHINKRKNDFCFFLYFIFLEGLLISIGYKDDEFSSCSILLFGFICKENIDLKFSLKSV